MAKFWIISDTHFGVKNNSKRWEELMKKWMDGFFFPLMENNVEEGDILVHCGDVFDNRQSVGLSTMSMCIGFFERLSGYFKEMWVLCGNHDAYLTTRNDITSIDCLKHIPGVNIVKTPVVENIFGKNVGFVPWTEDGHEFDGISFSAKKIDILFCHAEFSGCTMNSYGTKSESVLDIPNISRIYTGHIHHMHRYKNVVYVGSPYQLTQNDRNNSKCVWTYDVFADKEKFYSNTFSPEFTRMEYDKVKDMTFGEFKQICGNRFVEIETDGNLMAKCRFQKMLSLLKDNDNIMDMSFVPVNKDNTFSSDINISECASISEMLDKYIDEMVICDAQTKKHVRAISKKLIHE